MLRIRACGFSSKLELALHKLGWGEIVKREHRKGQVQEEWGVLRGCVTWFANRNIGDVTWMAEVDILVCLDVNRCLASVSVRTVSSFSADLDNSTAMHGARKPCKRTRASGIREPKRLNLFELEEDDISG